jgi:crossover junction endodeoxyribonuclease RusA
MILRKNVFGTPAPQGSKSFKGLSKKGRAILAESSQAVKPWRDSVVCATRELWGSLVWNTTIKGPVGLEITFTVRRPKSAKEDALPDNRPDLSKLVRSTEDGLTDAGVWEDDARVVTCMARKVYPGAHPDSLPVPGAVIRIRSFAL